MLATNPQARVTAAQSAQHSFLEPLDKKVEEKELQFGSLGCEPEREASLEDGSDCKGKSANLDERLRKLEFSLVEEVSRLKNKMVEEAGLNAAATTRLSKLEMEFSRLNNEKQNEEGQVDELKQKVENLERRCSKLKSSEFKSLSKVESKVSELKTLIEVTTVEVDKMKQSLVLLDGKVESALETTSSCEKRISKIETVIEEVKIEKVESNAVIELREKADRLEQLYVGHQETINVGSEQQVWRHAGYADRQVRHNVSPHDSLHLLPLLHVPLSALYDHRHCLSLAPSPHLPSSGCNQSQVCRSHWQLLDAPLLY